MDYRTETYQITHVKRIEFNKTENHVMVFVAYKLNLSSYQISSVSISMYIQSNTKQQEYTNDSNSPDMELGKWIRNDIANS